MTEGLKLKLKLSKVEVHLPISWWAGVSEGWSGPIVNVSRWMDVFYRFSERRTHIDHKELPHSTVVRSRGRGFSLWGSSSPNLVIHSLSLHSICICSSTYFIDSASRQLIWFVSAFEFGKPPTCRPVGICKFTKLAANASEPLSGFACTHVRLADRHAKLCTGPSFTCEPFRTCRSVVFVLFNSCSIFIFLLN